MKLLRIVFFVAVCMMCGSAFAQQKGRVEVIKDPQIDSLIARRLELSRSVNNGSALFVQGFRVQIFSGSDRKQAYAVQSRFRATHPGINAYVSYTQPDYKVRVGDFRTRLEAEKLINKLKPYYPGLFIFSERINPR